MTAVVLADRFELERIAGRGGMGIVYRALDRHTGEVVALKLLQQDGDEETERFMREAEVLAELRHPAIVRYVAHGTTPAGERYLAMEWLEGESLSDRLKREALGQHESVLLAQTVAEGLAAAHRRGIVHRDLKPSNLHLVDGHAHRVKIIDFGIARRRGRELTMTGAAIGTPGYMAPEQARGEKEVDARADVFSLGCVLFKCITGRAAFLGDDALAILLKIVLEEAPRLSTLYPDVPRDLDDLVARMLAKAPGSRPADGEALAIELASLGALPSAAAPSYDLSPALTTDEQRVIAVVLARAPARGGLEATLSTALAEGVTRSLAEAVAVHRGELARLADGSIVVTVSTSEAATDQAARAARCALAMRPLLGEVPMALAIGHGMAGERVPVGDAIDRAVRVLALGPRIRVDDAAAGLLDTRFALLGDEQGLYLAGEHDATAPRTLLGRPTSCVGRDRELASLEAIFDECATEPVARVVLVTAPAGFGKTRLRIELVQRLAARDSPIEIWTARGDAMSAGAPFGLLGPLLRRTAGVLEGELPSVRQQKLRARVGRHVPKEDQARITRFLGELAAIPFPDDGVELRAARADPRLLGDQMRRAWEEFLSAECSAQPVVIVLDDLQHGDLPSVTFLDDALRALPERPLLVFATARPEALDLFPDLWGARNVERIRLQPLTKKSSERLVREVLGELDAATVALVVERAGGNAYHLEELIRAVAEGKRDELPSTVLAMTQARLDALDPEARRMLRAASVFGQAFWKRGLVALLGGEKRTLDLGDWLATLVEREVLSRRAHAKFPAEEEYVFRHAPLRDTAYATLTPEDRTLGHRLAAEWLLGAGEAEPLVLAEHFERGESPEQAVGFYCKAAEHSLRGGDLSATLARAERGIACGARGEELGALRLLEAEAHGWRGENASTEERGLEAMTWLPQGSGSWFRAAAEVVTASGRLAHQDTLGHVARELLAPGLDDGDRREHLIALARAALHCTQSGLVELGEHLLERVSELVSGDAAGAASTALDPAVRGWILRARSTVASFGGDLGTAALLTTRSVAEFDAAGDARNAGVQRINCGYMSLELGQYAEAIELLRAALASAERLGLENHVNVAKNNLGLALARGGAIEEGRRIEEEAIAVFDAQGEKRLGAGCRYYLALILMAAWDLPGAESAARAAVEVGRTIPTALPTMLGGLAHVLLARGDTAGASSAAREAKALLDAMDAVEEGESLIRLSYAEALHAAGDVEGARAAIAEARERLLARAAKIQRSELRESFLRAVPENARTLTIAAAWLGAEDGAGRAPAVD